MQRILAATDLSERGQQAQVRGLHLARQFGAGLTVLHVVDADQPFDLRDRALESSRTWLETALGEAAAAGVAVEVEVLPGAADDTIVEVAEQLPADLIVMGAHRRHRLKDVFVGTTIERVIRAAALTVLMVNRAFGVPYDKALVALDLGAAGLGFLEATTVVLLHAHQTAEKVVLAAGGVDPTVIATYDTRVAGQALEALRRTAEHHAATLGPNVTLRILVEDGPALQVIERVAEREATPLVVIASRSHSGVLRLLLGSTADAYLRTTITTDVLVVPPPAAGTAANASHRDADR